MGKKQRAKQENRQQPAAKPPVPKRNTVYWAVALVALLVVALTTIVVVFQTHKVRFWQTGILAAAAAAEDQLNRHLGQFAYDDSRQLSEILKTTRQTAMNPDLDARAAGQLRFILGALEEIAQAGNLEAGEMNKLKTLLFQTQRYLQRLHDPRHASRP